MRREFHRLEFFSPEHSAKYSRLERPSVVFFRTRLRFSMIVETDEQKNTSILITQIWMEIRVLRCGLPNILPNFTTAGTTRRRPVDGLRPS